MPHLYKRIVALLLCIAMLAGMSGCQFGQPRQINIQALFATLLAQVRFATPLEDTGDDATVYFPALPQGASLTLYLGSGYFADEAALIILESEDDADDALDAVETHLEQKRNQFMNYIPEELGKIGDAVVWQESQYIIVCITDDTQTAQEILDDPSDPSYTVPADTSAPTTEPTTAPTTEPTTQPTTSPTTEPVTEPPTEAPTTPTTQPPVTEPSTEAEPIHYYKSGMIRVGNTAYETYFPNEGAASNYAAAINYAAEKLGDSIQVYDLLVPTAISIVFPEDMIPFYPSYPDQHQVIRDIFGAVDDRVVKLDCYEHLRAHRDEDIYFRTDYHWNGPGAYYAYEVFCQAKGITPYTMEQRTELRFDNFLGALYWLSCDKDPILAETPDTVIAHLPASEGVTMYYLDAKGNRTDWPVIADVSDWAPRYKYNAFAGGDNPLTVFTNPAVTDGSACIVVKESFGNAMMSYIVDHYSTVYEIDYRYWKGDLAAFARENGVTDVLFVNNLSMTLNNYLIGKIRSLFK